MRPRPSGRSLGVVPPPAPTPRMGEAQFSMRGGNPEDPVASEAARAFACDGRCLRALRAWPSVPLAVGEPAGVSLGFPSAKRGARHALALRGKPH